MIAVVLAAGRGTRLDNGVPKPLVAVAGVPMIDRILEALFAEGFGDVVIVTGHRAREIEAHAADRQVRFARQDEPLGTAHGLLAARDAIGDQSFLVSWVDVIVPPGTYRLTATAASGRDGAVATNHLDDLSAGGAVTVENGLAISVVEKPGPISGWNLTGVLALSQGIWSRIDALHPSRRGEYELPEAVNAWIAAGAKVAAISTEGPVFEVGTPEGLDAADAYFSGDTRSA